jgi:hydrogenase nickel incorporation protein HypA/HybF
MHELSIALSMIEQIEREAEKNGGGAVEAVHVRIGVLSGVDPQALRFAYELACEGSGLKGSRLEIESVDLLVRCGHCNATYNPDPQNLLCPHCPAGELEILQGRELELTALELAA